VTRSIGRSILAAIAITVVFGFAFPLLVTGVAQLFFQDKANGSLITVNGRVIGSRLEAQAFTKPFYFHPRPSGTTPPYNGALTTFANLGPTNPALAKNVAAQAKGILRLEGPYNPGLTVGDIPVDAVTTSGSGMDPDISPAYADLQARRIAATRHLPLSRVQSLISQNTDDRSLGFLGEPGVNVLDLNLALDREAPQ
jgi:potassium-transporting ATPase KdpC subunit